MMYEVGCGEPPMNCNICGCRVPRHRCERHLRESGWIALRDKYVGIFIQRSDRECGGQS